MERKIRVTKEAQKLVEVKSLSSARWKHVSLGNIPENMLVKLYFYVKLDKVV